MLNFFDIIIAGLAIWRISHMLKYEAGPWDIFIRIRDKAGDGIIGQIMDCVWCSSVWLGAMFFIPGIKYFMIVMAISALAILLEYAYGIMLRTEIEKSNLPEAKIKTGNSGCEVHRSQPNIHNTRTYERTRLPF